jgi:hypothetical protein
MPVPPRVWRGVALIVFIGLLLLGPMVWGLSAWFAEE